MKETAMTMIEDFFARHEDWNALRPAVEEAAALWIGTFRTGHKMLLCGNGGSCADCGHIAGELMKGFLRRRPMNEAFCKQMEALYGCKGSTLAKKLQQGLPAIDLTAHGAVISAFANDVDAELVYAQQVVGYGQPGDLLLAISTSGNAANVNAAVQTARAQGLRTMGLTGRDGGKLKENCEFSLIAPARETYLIQEMHIAIYHLLCAVTEAELFAQ